MGYYDIIYASPHCTAFSKANPNPSAESVAHAVRMVTRCFEIKLCFNSDAVGGGLFLQEARSIEMVTPTTSRWAVGVAELYAVRLGAVDVQFVHAHYWSLASDGSLLVLHPQLWH